MGSTINPATFGSFKDFSRDFKSLYGIISYPGINGPKPFVEEGSVEDEIAPSVLPQKFPSTKIIFALFFGIFLISYPHFLANLTAVSPPSTPVFIGNTLS